MTSQILREFNRITWLCSPYAGSVGRWQRQRGKYDYYDDEPDDRRYNRERYDSYNDRRRIPQNDYDRYDSSGRNELFRPMPDDRYMDISKINLILPGNFQNRLFPWIWSKNSRLKL